MYACISSQRQNSSANVRAFSAISLARSSCPGLRPSGEPMKNDMIEYKSE